MHYQISSLIKKSIKDNLHQKSGLLLLPFPTGSGKTTAIKDIILEREVKKKIFYLINLKSHRDEMYKSLIDGGMREDEILLLHSNFDMLKEFLKSDRSLSYLKKYPQIIQILDEIKFLIKSAKNVSDSEVKDYFIQEAVKKESLFRKELLEVYKRLKDEQKVAFSKDVYKIYPSKEEIESKKVIISTLHKFVLPIFLLEGSFSLHIRFKNSLIFIDEFDTQKLNLLDIFSSFDKEGEYFHIVSDLVQKSYFSYKKILKKYGLDLDIIRKFDSFYEEVKLFYDEFNLSYPIKWRVDEFKSIVKTNFSLYISEYTKDVYLKCDKNRGQNLFVKDEGIDKKYHIDYILVRLFNIIDKFIRLIRDVYLIFLKEPETTNKRLSSFLNELIIDGNNHKISSLIERVKNSVAKVKIDKQMLNGIEEIYLQKYYLIELLDKDEHYTKTLFNFSALYINPELFLKYLVKNNLVIGISATAFNKSKIHNFDLSFFKEDIIYLDLKGDKEGFSHFLPSIPKKSNLAKKIVEINDDYELFLDEDIDEVIDVLLLLCDRNEFKISRYINFLIVYKEFLVDEKIHSFLYLTNRYLFDFSDRSYFDIDTVSSLIELMAKSDLEVAKRLKKSDKKDKEEYFKERYRIYLASAKRGVQKSSFKDGVFLMSVYKYASKGHNFDYELDDKKKDFDGIYLEEITNILGSIDSSKEKLAKAYLLNILKNYGYISFDEYKRLLQSSNASLIGYKTTQDYVEAQMAFIVQALGRLFRTDSKNLVALFLQDKLKDIFKRYMPNKYMLIVPVLENALKKVKRDRELDDESIMSAKNLNQKEYFYTKQILKKLFLKEEVSKDYYEDVIQKWKNRREFILKNPTIKDVDLVTQRIYLKSKNNYYFYRSRDNFLHIDISWEYEEGFKEVSFESSNLKKILQIKEIKEFFTKNSYATSFKYKNVILPIIFNNYYKAAIGEVVGRFIFESYLNYPLYEIEYEDEVFFESFDFCRGDIYFDFKNYSLYSLTNPQIYSLLKDTLVKKSLNIKNKKIFIINLFLNGSVKDYSDKISKEEIEGNTVYFVPFLIALQNSKPTISQSILNQLRKIL